MPLCIRTFITIILINQDIEEIGNQPRYLAPLGMADNFPNAGLNISEMAWYAKTKIDDLTIHALPAHHFSSRVLVPFIYEDNDKDLWNGWLLEQNGSTLFFAGRHRLLQTL